MSVTFNRRYAFLFRYNSREISHITVTGGICVPLFSEVTIPSTGTKKWHSVRPHERF